MHREALLQAMHPQHSVVPFAVLVSHHFGVFTVNENRFTLISLPTPLNYHLYDFLQGKFRHSSDDKKEFF
jgi:hypothetical protein